MAEQLRLTRWHLREGSAGIWRVSEFNLLILRPFPGSRQRGRQWEIMVAPPVMSAEDRLLDDWLRRQGLTGARFTRRREALAALQLAWDLDPPLPR